jgi:LPXTG-motif cell wall-anchored protein
MTKKNWLLIALGAVLVTAGGIFLANRKNNKDEKPPKKAPQVPITNPGDQSEFTTAASESELG